MWVWYRRPPIGAHFHPTPQSPPVPQQLGQKAHLRTVAAVLANATATTLVYPSMQGPAPARRPRGPAGRRRPAGRPRGPAPACGPHCSSSICFTGTVLTACLPRVCFIATAVRRSHSSCILYPQLCLIVLRLTFVHSAYSYLVDVMLLSLPPRSWGDYVITVLCLFVLPSCSLSVHKISP